MNVNMHIHDVGGGEEGGADQVLKTTIRFGIQADFSPTFRDTGLVNAHVNFVVNVPKKDSIPFFSSRVHVELNMASFSGIVYAHASIWCILLTDICKQQPFFKKHFPSLRPRSGSGSTPFSLRIIKYTR